MVDSQAGKSVLISMTGVSALEQSRVPFVALRVNLSEYA